MSEEYTPTEDELVETYTYAVPATPDRPDEWKKRAAEGRRGIARIRAEALREAAAGVFDTDEGTAEAARYLEARADQIEKETT